MNNSKRSKTKSASSKTLFNKSFVKSQIQDCQQFQTNYFESIKNLDDFVEQKKNTKRRKSQNQLNISVKIKNLNINNYNKEINRNSLKQSTNQSVRNKIVNNILKQTNNDSVSSKQNKKFKIIKKVEQQVEPFDARPQTSKNKLNKYQHRTNGSQSFERGRKKSYVYMLQQNQPGKIIEKKKLNMMKSKKSKMFYRQKTDGNQSKKTNKKNKIQKEKKLLNNIKETKTQGSNNNSQMNKSKDVSKNKQFKSQIITFSFIKELKNLHAFYLQFLDIVQQNKINILFLEKFEKQLKKKKFYLEKVIQYKVFEKLFKENFILEKWAMLTIYFSIKKNSSVNSNFVRISLILYQTFIFFLNVLDTQLKKDGHQKNHDQFEEFIKVNILPKNSDFYVFKIKQKEMKQFLQKSKQELLQFLEQKVQILNDTQFILSHYSKISHKDNHKKLDQILYLQLKKEKSIQNSSEEELVILPPKSSSDSEYTLILDLDETLVHFPTDKKSDQILLRPFLKHFLEQTSKYYELIVFTASQKQYADWIIDRIDEQKFIKHRLYRQHLKIKNKLGIKDLCLLGRDLKKSIIIDNQGSNFSKHPQNGLEISTWTGDAYDQALLDLIPFLKSILIRNSIEKNYGYS